MKMLYTLVVTVTLALVTFANAQGEIGFGSSVDARISSSEFYQTYTVDVPEGISFLVIYLDGEDVDLDLAVNYGSDVGENPDFIDQSLLPDALYTLQDPQAGTYYIDVMNWTEEGSDFTLTASSNLPTGEARLVADTTDSTIVGLLSVQSEATGSLAGELSSASYHTYMISVPEGTNRLKIEVRGDADIDLYAKHGSEILSYEDESDGGDWDHRNNSTRNRATFNIRNPQSGLWYVDVTNGTGDLDAIEYTLNVSTR